MRSLIILLIIGIAASGWAANKYLGGLAEDESGIIRREFETRVSKLESKARSGNILSQYKLARLYSTAHELVADPVLAAQWMERAATKGHVKSQYYFGQMLERGTGLRRDLKNSILWYERAARNGGDGDALYALGRMYNTGVGVGHDTVRAVDYYRQAAQNNQPAAQYQVGRMYETGWGVQVDMIQAYFWYSLSERHRAQALKFDPKNDPREAVQRIDKLLNNSQRDFGKKLLKKWPASP